MNSTNYYISTTGGDSNSGTSSSPWKTLAYAGSKVKAQGDNVHKRGNMSVHHCTIVDFSSTGIIVVRGNSWKSQPVTFSSGNQIYYNNITNCHGVTVESWTTLNDV